MHDSIILIEQNYLAIGCIVSILINKENKGKEAHASFAKKTQPILQ
jgi:hypothetical protein